MSLSSVCWRASLGAAFIAVSTMDAQQSRGGRAESVVAAESRSVSAERVAHNVFSRPVTVALRDVPLAVALKSIAASAGIMIQYQGETLAQQATPVTLQVVNIPLGTMLERVLRGRALEAVPSTDQVVTIRRVSGDVVQGASVVGVVVHAKTKQPVAGATITVGDAAKGVVSGEDGRFRLTLSPGEYTLRARGLGFVRQVRSVTVVEGQTATVEFVLEPSTSVLDEVVVTGTVVATERKAIPTPITVITADEIEKRGITRIEELLRGEVPGVLALDRGSQSYSGIDLGEMAKTRVYSRGSTSLNGQANPLKTYIDGVEMLDPTYLGTIDPRSIERIEIITGPQAATIYGSGAVGGVMQIFTKKGSGRSAPEVTVTLKYGVMQSSFSDGKTPNHEQGVLIAGGQGSGFTYTATGTHTYTGQWQPNLFTRTYGGSLGATSMQGPVTVSGSASFTGGENGQVGSTIGLCGRMNSYGGCYPTAVFMQGGNTGEVYNANPAVGYTNRKSTSSSQTLGMTVDYRAMSLWQHHLTFGRAQTNFEQPITPPYYYRPSDSLYRKRFSAGRRLTMAYNSTIAARMGALAPTATVGLDATWAQSQSFDGRALTKTTSSWNTQANFLQAPDDRRWGGFGSLQVGLFDRVFLTTAVRGERNIRYGSDYGIDWTPTQGVTYTIERGQVTLKLLASYGSATRPPVPDQKEEVLQDCAVCNPARWFTRYAAPDLGPEYSRGSQGGFELYYGNLGSITVNHYSQRVDNLVQLVVGGDSVYIDYTPYNFGEWVTPTKYANVAAMRQVGWAGTASVNLGPLSLKGTYSWDDSRVTRVDPTKLEFGQYMVGQGFVGVPTHSGNIIASYAYGGTNVTWSMDYVGSQINDAMSASLDLVYAFSNGRLTMYSVRQAYPEVNVATYPGYVKSNLNVSHRVSPWATVTVDVRNLGNSYTSDVTTLFPTLGRKTMVGMALRYPTSR